MPSPAQLMVRRLLRDAGPLTIDELLARAPDWRPPRSKDRKGALRNALANDQLVANRGDGRYLYLPVALNGATMRTPVVAAEGEPGQLRVGEEVAVFLWPADEDRRGRPTASFALDGGPTVTVTVSDRPVGGRLGWDEPTVLVEPEAPFWDWWEERRRDGADELLLRCEEHEAGRFAVGALRRADLEPDAVAASNERVIDAARQAMKGTEGMLPTELARRLLARGVYGHEPAPDPLFAVLLAPDAPFIIEMGYRLAYRPELTPALRRIFARRIASEREGAFLAGFMELIDGDQDALDAEDADGPLAELPPRRVVPPARVGYRIKIALERAKQVWRIVEILDNQTFEDLHDAIQAAFGWDDDHLYAFYLSGRFGDRLTELGRPTGEDWDEPPLVDEVLLADAELRPGQRIAYRFDFMADIDHVLEVQAVLPAPAGAAQTAFPRLVESHGDAPPQDDAGDGSGLIFVIHEYPW